MSERERFEAWARSERYDVTRAARTEPRDYHGAATQDAWVCWQAARPAVDYEAAYAAHESYVEKMTGVRHPLNAEGMANVRGVVNAALAADEAKELTPTQQELLELTGAVVLNPSAIGDPDQTPVVQVSPAVAASIRKAAAPPQPGCADAILSPPVAGVVVAEGTLRCDGKHIGSAIEFAGATVYLRDDLRHLDGQRVQVVLRRVGP